jgi:cytochrome c553
VRDDPLMTPMAKTLSDADIDNLAAYYNNLQPGQ